MRSLRGRLTLWLLAGTALLLGTGGLLLDRVISARLLLEFDAGLIAEAKSLESLTEGEGTAVWIEFSDEVMPQFEARTKPHYFQLWRADGAVVERSRSLGPRNLPRSGALLGGQPLADDVTLPDGRPGRRVELRFYPRPEESEEWGPERPAAPRPRLRATGEPVTLVVAEGREELDAFRASVHRILTLGILGLLAGTALLVKVVVGVGLSPLDDLAHRLSGMGPESLGQPLATPDAPTELVPVITHLDGLLERLRESFERERAFSSNLAHELRTPLAELRVATEVALKWPEDTSSWLASFVEIHDIGLQMERTVVNLLALARCDSRLQTVWTSEVSLREVAVACLKAVASEAAEKSTQLELAIPSELTAVTDRDLLALILTNLFSNAVAHGSGKTVRCSATGVGNELALTISNSVEGIDRGDLPRLFDRFWRKDPARSPGRHAGLGLSLVAALCELLGLTKEVRLAAGEAQFILRGPLTGPQSSAVAPLSRPVSFAGRSAL